MSSGRPFFGNTCFEWFVVVVIIVVVILIVMPLRPGPGNKAREAECKAGLHNIQLSIERYGVDNDGYFPRYLIGGEAKYAGEFTTDPDRQPVDLSKVPLEGVSDPLLREGYLDSYPRNPFVRQSNGQQLHNLQEALSTSITGNDPLRNGAPEGALRGTRFGPYCTTMGQVLCDPRAEKFSYVDPETGETRTEDSWAIVEYQFWDMWGDTKRDRKAYYPEGQFFYKAAGPISNEALELSETEPAIPLKVDKYMLGVYGSERTRGKDVIGEEWRYTYNRDDEWLNEAGMLNPFPWTRSQLGAETRQGSPFGFWGEEELRYSNPNGIRDGIIFALTASEDYL